MMSDVISLKNTLIGRKSRETHADRTRFATTLEEIRGFAERCTKWSASMVAEMTRETPFDQITAQLIAVGGFDCDVLTMEYDREGVVDWHSHNATEHVIQVEGASRITFEDQSELIFRAPDGAYTIPANTLHRVEAIGNPCKTIAVVIPINSTMGAPHARRRTD